MDYYGRKVVWHKVRPFQSVENIKEFEKKTSFSFPDAYKECIMSYNGGCPDTNHFTTPGGTEVELRAFLSFNKGDEDNIVDVYEWTKDSRAPFYIPFAIDKDRRLVCFDATTKSIVLVDIGKTEPVTETFGEFLKMLF